MKTEHDPELRILETYLPHFAPVKQEDDASLDPNDNPMEPSELAAEAPAIPSPPTPPPQPVQDPQNVQVASQQQQQQVCIDR